MNGLKQYLRIVVICVVLSLTLGCAAVAIGALAGYGAGTLISEAIDNDDD